MPSSYKRYPAVGGGSGIASINGDTTSAQIIQGGNGISVGTSAGTTTIAQGPFTGPLVADHGADLSLVIGSDTASEIVGTTTIPFGPADLPGAFESMASASITAVAGAGDVSALGFSTETALLGHFEASEAAYIAADSLSGVQTLFMQAQGSVNTGQLVVDENKVGITANTVSINLLDGLIFGTGGVLSALTPTDGNTFLTIPEIDNGSSGATKTIDFANGPAELLTLSADCVLTLSNPLSGAAYVIRVIQGASPFTITWPVNVLWPGGTAPTLSPAAGNIDLINLYYDGTSYYGTFAQNFS